MKTKGFVSPASMPVTSTLLLVDDNADFVEFLKLLLSHEGFNLQCALGGAQGLEIVRSEPVDLIILDVMMPKMDGLAVCKELKRIAPSLPVILLTAKDDLATRSAAMTLGVSEFLAKPVNIEDLLTRVRTQIHIRQWQRRVDNAFSIAERETKIPPR